MKKKKKEQIKQIHGEKKRGKKNFGGVDYL